MEDTRGFDIHKDISTVKRGIMPISPFGVLSNTLADDIRSRYEAALGFYMPYASLEFKHEYNAEETGEDAQISAPAQTGETSDININLSLILQMAAEDGGYNGLNSVQAIKSGPVTVNTASGKAAGMSGVSVQGRSVRISPYFNLVEKAVSVRHDINTRVGAGKSIRPRRYYAPVPMQRASALIGKGNIQPGRRRAMLYADVLDKAQDAGITFAGTAVDGVPVPKYRKNYEEQRQLIGSLREKLGPAAAAMSDDELLKYASTSQKSENSGKTKAAGGEAVHTGGTAVYASEHKPEAVTIDAVTEKPTGGAGGTGPANGRPETVFIAPVGLSFKNEGPAATASDGSAERGAESSGTLTAGASHSSADAAAREGIFARVIRRLFAGSAKQAPAVQSKEASDGPESPASMRREAERSAGVSVTPGMYAAGTDTDGPVKADQTVSADRDVSSDRTASADHTVTASADIQLNIKTEPVAGTKPSAVADAGTSLRDSIAAQTSDGITHGAANAEHAPGLRQDDGRQVSLHETYEPDAADTVLAGAEHISGSEAAGLTPVIPADLIYKSETGQKTGASDAGTSAHRDISNGPLASDAARAEFEAIGRLASGISGSGMTGAGSRTSDNTGFGSIASGNKAVYNTASPDNDPRSRVSHNTDHRPDSGIEGQNTQSNPIGENRQSAAKTDAHPAAHISALASGVEEIYGGKPDEASQGNAHTDHGAPLHRVNDSADNVSEKLSIDYTGTEQTAVSESSLIAGMGAVPGELVHRSENGYADTEAGQMPERNREGSAAASAISAAEHEAALQLAKELAGSAKTENSTTDDHGMSGLHVSDAGDAQAIADSLSGDAPEELIFDLGKNTPYIPAERTYREEGAASGSVPGDAAIAGMTYGPASGSELRNISLLENTVRRAVRDTAGMRYYRSRLKAAAAHETAGRTSQAARSHASQDTGYSTSGTAAAAMSAPSVNAEKPGRTAAQYISAESMMQGQTSDSRQYSNQGYNRGTSGGQALSELEMMAMMPGLVNLGEQGVSAGSPDVHTGSGFDWSVGSTSGPGYAGNTENPFSFREFGSSLGSMAYEALDMSYTDPIGNIDRQVNKAMRSAGVDSGMGSGYGVSYFRGAPGPVSGMGGFEAIPGMDMSGSGPTEFNSDGTPHIPGFFNDPEVEQVTPFNSVDIANPYMANLAPSGMTFKKEHNAPSGVDDTQLRPQPAPQRMSEAEIRRSADRIYSIIKDKIKLERRTMGLR